MSQRTHYGPKGRPCILSPRATFNRADTMLQIDSDSATARVSRYRIKPSMEDLTSSQMDLHRCT